MGLATRIIPTVLHRRGRMVKGRGFRADRIVGHAMQASRIYASRNIDELVLLDVDQGESEPDYAMVAQLSDKCFFPLAVGGRVRSVDHVRSLLFAGADKVVICTGAAESPSLIAECARRFGSQAVVCAVDVRDGVAYASGGSVAIGHCTDWLAECVRAGAGEILLQSIERDGTMEGYDLDLIDDCARRVPVPLVASGGCSGYDDMLQAIYTGADAVAAGALFLFSDSTPAGAARYLAGKGIDVRAA